jgi:hypothetical protein
MTQALYAHMNNKRKKIKKEENSGEYLYFRSKKDFL